MSRPLVGMLLALLAGCALYTPTQFTEWRGPAEFKGAGGTVRNIDGVDVWTFGEPDRRFKLLGLIEQDYYDNNSVMSFLAGATKDSRIIKAAKEQGGDAIIILRRDSRLLGYSAYSVGTLSANTQTTSIIAVVKYLD
jgi:hypothetical protein